jgi:hypothetical protein
VGVWFASAAAQPVLIYDLLDPDLEWCRHFYSIPLRSKVDIITWLLSEHSGTSALSSTLADVGNQRAAQKLFQVFTPHAHPLLYSDLRP